MSRAVSLDDLEQYALFRGMTPEEKQLLLPVCQWQECVADEMVTEEGMPADRFYLIQQGRVAVEMHMQLGSPTLGHRTTTDVLRAGQYFGWSVLVPPHIYTSSVVCLEPTRLLMMDGEQLRRLTEVNHSIGYHFYRLISSVMAAWFIRTRNTLVHALSILSHDLKAPLVATQTYLQVVAGGFAGDVNEEQRDMLERSVERLGDLLTMIGDILDVSRIETGRLEQEFRQLSLAAVAKRSLTDMQGLADSRGVRLTVDLPEDGAPMVGSAGRLLQVFNNLLSNAIKFTPSGGQVRLRIRDNGPQWQVEVSDTGIGIRREELPFIFQDFYRASNSGVEGSGLGLAIAKKIVAAHDGRIWAESPDPETNTGSAFTFVLPKGLKPYIPKAKEEANA